MKELLLQEKWRPKKIEDLVVLDRISNIVNNNPKNNYIFYGRFGTGKTTLARILIGSYSKKNPFLEINTSLNTSIETLRTTIEDFCSKSHIGFDLDEEVDTKGIKFVLLDEFERASAQFQDALKVYIEDYSRRNVRFILITNHINKVSPGIRSRMVEVNFDCQSLEERKELKSKLYKRITNKILPEEGIEIPKEPIIEIINKRFPDFRRILIGLDVFIKTGKVETESTDIEKEVKENTYKIVFTESSFDDVYHFLMDNYTDEKIEVLLDSFGREFIEWVYNNKKDKVEKLFDVCSLVTDYKNIFSTQSDPIVLAVSFIGKMKQILK